MLDTGNPLYQNAAGSDFTENFRSASPLQKGDCFLRGKRQRARAAVKELNESMCGLCLSHIVTPFSSLASVEKVSYELLRERLLLILQFRKQPVFCFCLVFFFRHQPGQRSVGFENLELRVVRHRQQK